MAIPANKVLAELQEDRTKVLDLRDEMQASTTDVLMAAAIGIIAADCFRLSGQPGRTDVGPDWLRLGACNARSSLGVPNGFTVAASTSSRAEVALMLTR